MRIVISPVVDPQREIDLTQRLVAAIAEELWRHYGGNEELNWLEAEMHLQGIVGEAKAEARETVIVAARPPIAAAETKVPTTVAVADPRRLRRATPGQGQSGFRPRAARPVQRQTVDSA